MLKVSIFVEGVALELFKDETIEINSSVQNIADISKTFSDFSQSFTVPASNVNNGIFQHYYNTDVDGTFNPNIRVLGYIELGSLPYKFGAIQLEEVKIKQQKPSAYTIRFFSSVVNLSDLFKEDELSLLPLSAYNHAFNPTIFDATYDETIANGDVYYPLITSLRNLEVGTSGTSDITNVSGQLKYNELKPALRLNKIFDAISSKYGVTFKDNFLNRAVFDNLFMWIHKESGKIDAFGAEVAIDITVPGGLPSIGVTVDTTNNTIQYTNTTANRYNVILKIVPEVGYTDVNYKARIYNNGIASTEGTGTGMQDFLFESSEFATFLHRFSIQSVGDFQFKAFIIVGAHMSITTIFEQSNTPLQTLSGYATMADLMPKMKVKDFVTSIIKMFNLVLVPVNSKTFTLIPLDDWYAQGKLIDISDYVSTEDVTVKRPKLFKKIDFKHQTTGQILGDKFRENNGGVGYGDLRSTYAIDGTELKIETQFENLVFERLTNVATSSLTKIQVGKSIDKKLAPYIGKPFIFYRCGYQFYDTPIKAENHADLTYTWLTSTENDLLANQVSNTVNFSSDISTFLYSEITRNLFSNYWGDYISDLYSLKRRITNYVAHLPIGVLIKLKLNDRIKIGSYAYIINSMKPNLTTGKVDFELLNYIGIPFTSVNDNIMLTADTVNYFADNTHLTADMISIYQPAYNGVPNGVQFTALTATPSAQSYDCKITANQSYLATKVDTGGGVNWVTLQTASGTGTDYLKIKFSKFPIGLLSPLASRAMNINVAIGGVNFVITIIQRQV